MEGGTALSGVLRALLALLGVCALAWVLIPLLARRGLFRLALPPSARGARLRVLERVALSPRRQLYLVQADSRVFLLGAGEAGAPSLIAELEPPSVPGSLSSQRSSEAAN
jgi:flagellar biogenesis protein FliO